MPFVSDAEIYQDSDYTLAVTVWTTTAKTLVFNLTGFTLAEYRVGSLLNDITDLLVVGTIVDAANGRIDFPLTDVQTLALVPGKHNQQITVTDATSNKRIITDGFVTVKEALV